MCIRDRSRSGTPPGGRSPRSRSLTPKCKKIAAEKQLCFNKLSKGVCNNSNCKFTHDIPGDFKPQFQPSTSGGTRPIRKPTSPGGSRSKLKCRHGPDCKWHKMGRCKFSHFAGMFTTLCRAATGFGLMVADNSTSDVQVHSLSLIHI